MTRLSVGHLRRAAPWAVLIWSLAAPLVEAAPSISRTFEPFELGMPIKEFLATVPADEIGAVGDDRLFSVIGLRVNVTGIWCTFTRERLSRIEITFSVEYSSRTPWKEFLASATREYGTGFHLPVSGGDVEMWDDGRTTLVLERRPVTARDLAYVVTLFDDAVAIEHGGRCAPKYSV